jgi:hypothetical protein
VMYVCQVQSSHAVEIIFDAAFIGRPFGCRCAVCGIFAACVTQAEAEECARVHQIQHENEKR